MAEGGREFGYEDGDLDHLIDNDDEYEEEVDTTRPFQPGAASTPYHGGEEHEMQTWMHERGFVMPPYPFRGDAPEVPVDEPEVPGDAPNAPLLGEFYEKEDFVQRARNFIKARFPRADFRKLGPIGISKKGTGEIVSFGRKGGETKIFKANKSGLLKNFTDRFSTSLGPSAEEILAEDRDNIQEQRQRAAEADEQLRQANGLAEEREKEEQENQNLKQKIERTQAQMDDIDTGKQS